MNDKSHIIKAAALVTAVLIFCYIVIQLVDNGFNGILKEWIYANFDLNTAVWGSGKIGALYSNWSDIRLFIIVFFIVLIIIWTVNTVLIITLVTRRQKKKDIDLLTKSLITFMKSESDEFIMPEGYREIETHLIRLKALFQKNEQLMKTEMQRKNDLITYLAHDLKTPLASVIGYLSLLNEAPELPERQKEKYIETALAKAGRLEELINEFFDITRFNLQSIVLNKTKIKLAFMLEQMAEEFYPLLEPKKKRVELHVPDDLIIIGDADKLARVFNNILKNAIAYSFEDSTIEISAVCQGDETTIAFKNQGNPIPKQRLDIIFEKFYRLDSSRSADTGGAGLGLAIAREIVAAHGGTIEAESDLSQTVFTVKLP